MVAKTLKNGTLWQGGDAVSTQKQPDPFIISMATTFSPQISQRDTNDRLYVNAK